MEEFLDLRLHFWSEFGEQHASQGGSILQVLQVTHGHFSTTHQKAIKGVLEVDCATILSDA